MDDDYTYIQWDSAQLAWEDDDAHIMFIPLAEDVAVNERLRREFDARGESLVRDEWGDKLRSITLDARCRIEIAGNVLATQPETLRRQIAEMTGLAISAARQDDNEWERQATAYLDRLAHG